MNCNSDKNNVSEIQSKRQILYHITQFSYIKEDVGLQSIWKNPEISEKNHGTTWVGLGGGSCI